jgi:hypothetical protein
MMNAKANVKGTVTNATYLNVRSSGCWGVHRVTVSDGYVGVTILRLGGNGIELKVMLKPDMPDVNWDYLRQVMLVHGMKNIGAGFFRVEVKAGLQVGPLATRFYAAKTQSDASKALGDIRPFAMIAMPEGRSDGIVLMTLEEFAELITLIQ